MSGAKQLVALLGATGETGMKALQQLLARGYNVKALVRSPHKIGVDNKNLQVVKVDIFDQESLNKGLEGCDVVMSCLGARPKDIGVSFYLHTIQRITHAMRENQISRIVTMTSWGTYRDPRSPYFIEYFFRYIIEKVLTSMREMELFLEEECSDLHYTVVRPPGLSSKPLSGNEIKVAEECPCVPQAWCAIVTMMPRADVAHFMIDCVEHNSYPQKAVAILTR